MTDYAILLDFQGSPRDVDAPVWDGWYGSKALAIGMLKYFKQEYPQARVDLVARVDPDPRPRRRSPAVTETSSAETPRGH
jgi:hypothetical protein